jgi:DNA primase
MSGYIENLDEIDSKLDIEAVLKDLGHDPGVIKHTGKNEIRFRCPIHKGENPNFAFNKDTTEWFCHSKCGKGETGIINLHKRITGGNLPDTAEYLANKFVIPTKFK